MLKPKQAIEVIRNRVKLPVSLDTLYNWIKKGRIKVRRLGRMVLIDPSDLEIFLADFPGTDEKISKVA